MLVYTQHSDTALNPIHSSLHHALSKWGIVFRYFLYLFIPYRRGIVYIHYPDACLASSSPWKMAIKTLCFVASISIAKAIRCPIIWEINNLTSHECRYPLIERQWMRLFVNWVNGTIHYSRTSVTQAFKQYPTLQQAPMVMVPHPNFLHLYPVAGDPSIGRRILGVKEGEIVLLCFGLIRRYKGIDQLVHAFKRIDNPRARLVVAGRPVDQDFADEVRLASEGDRRIRLLLHEIPANEVPDIHAASDLFCATFRTILNSGSVMLALTLGCPVLAPRLGSLQDLQAEVGPAWVKLYNETLDSRSLDEAIVWATSVERGIVPLAFSNIDKVAANIFDFLRKLEPR